MTANELAARLVLYGDLPVFLDMGQELRPIGELDTGNEYVILRADWYASGEKR